MSLSPAQQSLDRKTTTIANSTSNQQQQQSTASIQSGNNIQSNFYCNIYVDAATPAYPQLKQVPPHGPVS
eukprot:9119126-Ditylum_brightwellii.AAC.1